MLHLLLLVVGLVVQNVISFQSHALPYVANLQPYRIPRRFELTAVDPEIYTIDVTEPHPRTVETALKHCETFQRFAACTVVAQHTMDAFQQASTFVNNFYGTATVPKRVIIDSGCGAGLSTFSLASLYPDIPVIGVDRSVARLSRNKRIQLKNVGYENDQAGREEEGEEEEEEEERDLLETENTQLQFQKLTNAILLRAELSDFFLLISNQTDWVIHSHYLLYPNPYPKSKHLRRRWHGHPILPVILALGGKLVLRSNWNIYCYEMIQAVDAIVSASILPGLTCDIQTCAIGEEEGGVQQSYSAGLTLQTRKSTGCAIGVKTHFQNKFIKAGIPVYEVSFDLGERTKEQRLYMLNNIK